MDHTTAHGNDGGYFKDGGPGDDPTVVDAKFMNDVLYEFENALNQAGIVLAAGDREMLMRALLTSWPWNPIETDTGSANALAISGSVTETSYSDGMLYRVKVAADNAAGACTINVDGISAKSIKLLNGENPYAKDLKAGAIAELIYSSTADVFYLMNPAGGEVLAARGIQSSLTERLDYGLRTGGLLKHSGNSLVDARVSFEIDNTQNITIHSQFNVSSITVQAWNPSPMRLRVNLTTAMADANYAVLLQNMWDGSDSDGRKNVLWSVKSDYKTTSYFDIVCCESTIGNSTWPGAGAPFECMAIIAGNAGATM